MLPRPDRHDEPACDVMARATSSLDEILRGAQNSQKPAIGHQLSYIIERI